VSLRRSRISISIAAAALGVIVVGSVAYGSTRSNELRPGAGQEVNRPIPTSVSRSTAQGFVPASQSALGLSQTVPTAFTGVTFKDHRDADGGNQTSDTPPDQGLCEGNGVVIEPVNTTFSTYSTSGQLVSGPTSLTVFYTGKHEIDRSQSPPTFGPFLSDPRCYFDPDIGRFVMTILQIPFSSSGSFQNGRSNLLIAVSKGSTPTTNRNDWWRFKINTTDAGGPSNDGSGNTMPSQPGCPCFGDQPLLGADNYGIYVTTNEFSILGPEFNGAQIYAISKNDLFAGRLKYQAFHGTPIPLAEGAAYSLQPATSPSANSWNTQNGGTEYLMSALDFSATTDNRIAVWALTNTSSLRTNNPAVVLTDPFIVPSETYGQPPNANQKAGPTPLGTALGEPEEQLATDDDRMNQVVYAAGNLYGAVNTLIRTGSPTNTSSDRSGIAYFVVTPSNPTSTSVAGTMANQGYLALSIHNNLLYPSIAVNKAGKGAITFTVAGRQDFPTAGWTTIDAVNGAGPIKFLSRGAAPTDDLSGYAAFGGNGVARWGDYSAAVPSDDGSSIWLASEYIPGGFGYPPYLANWGTFVANVNP